MDLSSDTSFSKAPASSPALPDSIAGYTFLQRLPNNGGHETFLARHADTDMLVHIRAYALEDLRGDFKLRERIERRALAARAASHPNIVRAFPSFLTETDLFLVEEYCPGGDLFDLVRHFGRRSAAAPERGVPLPVARHVARGLMRGLRHLHAACGLAHRGVQLESVFIGADRGARLGRLCRCCAAFPAASAPSGPGPVPAPSASRPGPGSGPFPAASASAASGSAPSSSAAVSGSGSGSAGAPLRRCCAALRYAAPEIAAGRPYGGEAVDVWAAGVVLFVMLTGEFPFGEDAADTEALIGRIGAADEVLAAHAALAQLQDPIAADLVRGMLRANPASRLTIEEVIDHPFFREHTHMEAQSQ